LDGGIVVGELGLEDVAGAGFADAFDGGVRGVEHAGGGEAVGEAGAGGEDFIAVEVALHVEIAIGGEALAQLGDVIGGVGGVAEQADLVVGHVQVMSIGMQLGEIECGTHHGSTLHANAGA
jgi:hypothetical protein